MDNGAQATIDTETLSCLTWTLADGKEMMKGGKSAVVQCFPSADTPVKGHFVPEERAKKLSFDRMIYKLEPEDTPGFEYRVDITLRETSLEYEVIIKNLSDGAIDASNGMKFDTDAKITDVKGYTNTGDNAVSTGTWNIPTGKFKENYFYVKLEA